MKKAIVKVGTGPSESVYFKGFRVVGAYVNFKKLNHGAKWQMGKITKINQAAIFIELI